MTRLEMLKEEREQIKDMHCLSFDLKEQCQEWYDHEIEVLEHYEKLAEHYNKGVRV